MTSADDFHVLSLRNVLGLGAVIVAVLIPVGLKRVFRKDLGELGEADSAIETEAVDAVVIDVPSIVEVQTRRYQAVDSGVLFAGPSEGDPNFDTPSRLDKGKGRAVEIEAHVRNDVRRNRYDRKPTYAPLDKITSQKSHRLSEGYGSIESLDRRDIQQEKLWL